MATYHMSLKNGKPQTGEAHADYIMREGRYAGGKRAEELVYKDANLPKWAMSASAFFANSDLYERSNARAYTEFEIALPNELNHEDNKKLVEDFIADNIGNNKVWAYAIHSKPATFDATEEQIHAHIMFSERIVTDGMDKAKSPSKFFKRYNAKDPKKGGYKKDERFTTKEVGRTTISSIRQAWEDKINQAYKDHGIDKKVSCKSLSAQKAEAKELGDLALEQFLDREPQRHLGPALAYKTRKILDEEGCDNEHIDSTLDKLYEFSERAFCAVFDKIKKAQKEAAYRMQMQLEQEQKEKAYAEKKLAELERETITGENLRKDFYKLLKDIKIQIGYNDLTIAEMDKHIMTPQQIADAAIDKLTNGESKKLRDVVDNYKRLRVKLQKQSDRFKLLPREQVENTPEFKQYKQDLRIYYSSKKVIPERNAAIVQFQREHRKEFGLIVERLSNDNDEYIKHKNNMLKMKNEYIKLYNDTLEAAKKINPKLNYEFKKGTYRKPQFNFTSGVRATYDDLDNFDKALANCRTFEHIKRNKMTVDLHSKTKNNFWEM